MTHGAPRASATRPTATPPNGIADLRRPLRLPSSRPGRECGVRRGSPCSWRVTGACQPFCPCLRTSGKSTSTTALSAPAWTACAGDPSSPSSRRSPPARWWLRPEPTGCARAGPRVPARNESMGRARRPVTQPAARKRRSDGTCRQSPRVAPDANRGVPRSWRGRPCPPGMASWFPLPGPSSASPEACGNDGRGWQHTRMTRAWHWPDLPAELADPEGRLRLEPGQRPGTSHASRVLASRRVPAPADGTPGDPPHGGRLAHPGGGGASWPHAHGGGRCCSRGRGRFSV